jgi:hypothetical protein
VNSGAPEGRAVPAKATKSMLRCSYLLSNDNGSFSFFLDNLLPSLQARLLQDLTK